MMPAYNAQAFITAAIDSILRQTFSNWELIVVDDGSVDGTAAILNEVRDPRIRVLRQRNRGEAASRNVALAHATGEYLAFLDADDLFLPQHLSAAVSHLQTHTEDAGVYSDGYYITTDGQRIRTLSSRRRRPLSGRVFEEIVRANTALAPPLCVVLRTEVVRRHGLTFDEQIVIGTDWDFFRQFAAAGDFGYVPEVTCLYRLHATNITRRTRAEQIRRDTARCRSKAIRSAPFSDCALDIRVTVFYDLLVNALRGVPDRQRDAVDWEEFGALPDGDRSRLLRLVVSQAILDRESPSVVEQWLVRWRAEPAKDVRGALVSALYGLSPALCRWMLRARRASQIDTTHADPYADVTLPAEGSVQS